MHEELVARREQELKKREVKALAKEEAVAAPTESDDEFEVGEDLKPEEEAQDN